MAVRLGELLVSQGVITEEQLAAGLKAQGFFGGRLGTNLVELGHVTEAKLAQILSRQLGIPCAEAPEFESVPQEVLKLVPIATVQKHRIVPLALDKRTLKLAMSDPTDLRLIDELSFSTGCRIEPAVAPEVLILYGMERLYGIPRSSRYLKPALQSGLTGDFQVVQSSKPGQTDSLDTSGIEVEDRGDYFDIDRSDFVSQVRYTLEQAAADLTRVDNHQDVFEITRRFLCTHFDQLAVFTFRGDEVVGWIQSGCRLSDNDFRRLTFPRQKSLLFREGCRSAAPYLGKVPVTDVDTRLFKSLGIPTNEDLIFLPVLVNQRPATVIVASGPKRGAIKDRIAMYDGFAKKLGYAIQILYLKQQILGKAII